MAGAARMAMGDMGIGQGNEVQQTPARDINQEGTDTLQSQIALAPQQYAAYSQYAPQYAQTDVSTLGQSLFGSGYSGNLMDINQRLTDSANQQTAASNTALRTSNQADVSTLAPQIQAQLQASNPQFYSALDSQSAAAARGIQASPYLGQMGQMAGSSAYSPVSLNQVSPGMVGAPSVAAGQVGASRVYAPGGNGTLAGLAQQYQQQPGASQTQTMADSTAQNLLAQGGDLSPSELRNVQQSSRAGFAARGLDQTNASVVDEAMQTDAAHRARLMQNVSTAEGIEGLSQQERQAQQQFGLGVSGQRLNYGQLGVAAQQSNQSAGLQAGLANQGTNLQAQLANQSSSLQSQTTNVGLNYQAQLANNANMLAQQQANLGAQNQQFGQLGALATMDQGLQQANFAMGQQSLANYGSALFSPQDAVLGQNSGNVGVNGNLLGAGAGAAGAASSTVGNMFNPYSAYGSDLFGSNANRQQQTNVESARNWTSTTNSAQSADAQAFSSM
jgi:hypothetical protein